MGGFYFLIALFRCVIADVVMQYNKEWVLDESKHNKVG
jgi:hypothetical protein